MTYILNREQELYVSPSFPTISAAGGHAALCHYRPTLKTDRVITDQEIYLCDTGCQFRFEPFSILI